jgi:hypothetical protein
VSNLFLFGRRQAFCYQQEIDGSPGKRHHVRFWPTPDGWLLPGGRRVDWLAAGTFDRSVGLSVFTWQVTHRIADDVDVERDHVVATIRGSAPQSSVSIIENFSTGYHSRNGGGDAIVTDGDLPVVDLRAVPSATASAVAARQEGATARPVDVVVGALLMALRPVAVVFLLMPVLVDPTSLGSVLVDAPGVRTAVIVLATVFAGVWWFVASGVFRGRSGARLGALLLSGIAVVTVAVSWFRGDQELSMVNGLIGFAIDVAILFALSGREAREWTLGRKRRRRFREPVPIE